MAKGIVEVWKCGSEEVWCYFTMVTFLFLSAVMHKKVTHVKFFVFSAILAGQQFNEIQNSCYHDNMT